MTQTRRHRGCPICGGSGKPLFTNAMASLGNIDLSYTVCACSLCGSVFADYLATEAEYNQYYSAYSKYDVASENLGEANILVHERLSAAVAQLVDRSAHIVDIGCGSGHLLSCFDKHGFTRLTGIDPAPKAAQVAKERYGLKNIHKGFLGQTELFTNIESIDICCFSAVLEHLTDPFEQLTSVVELLRPGARIAVEVPDLDAFDGQNGEPYGELSLEHINYFSSRSLQVFFNRLGCQLEYCEPLRHSNGGSLLAIARKEAFADFAKSTGDQPVMEAYLRDSEIAFNAALARIAPQLTRRVLIYGAGSHTARLLPRLEKNGILHRCIAVVDNNPNLQGAKMNALQIIQSTELVEYTDCDVLISSFRFEHEIQKSLAWYPGKVFGIYFPDHHEKSLSVKHAE